MEIFEQSSEMMKLNESLGKKGNFRDVVTWMIQQTVERGDKPAAGGGGCCGGDDPVTPDSYISDVLPRLTENMLDILCGAPFDSTNELTVSDDKKIKFRGQMLLTTILDFARRVKGGALLEKRNIVISPPASKTAKCGETFDVGVRTERHAFVKDTHGARKRIFVGLVNMVDSTLMLKSAANDDAVVDIKFKVTA